MDEKCKAVDVEVSIQENGTIRGPGGYIIARLVDGIDFDSEHLKKPGEVNIIGESWEALSKVMKTNPDYAYFWYFSIANFCIQAIEAGHKTANKTGYEAAGTVMKRCFGVDAAKLTPPGE